MIQSMKKNGLILGLFGLAATTLVALTHSATKTRIAEQQQQQLFNTIAQLIPSELYNNQPAEQCYWQYSSQFLGTEQPMAAFIATYDGQPTAVALEAIAPDGYNGQIALIVGIDWQGQLLGVRTLSHNETPGLGDLIDKRRSNWVDNFIGYRLESETDPRFAVKRDGGDFDQFTGATLTPRAYVKAVKNALIYFQYHQQNLINGPMCGAST